MSALSTRHNFKDITGQTFGRLTAVERAGSDKRGKVKWLCRCSCGRDHITYGTNLRLGHTRMCRWCAERSNFKHGQCSLKHGGWRTMPEYAIWQGMIRRCYTPTNHNYPGYGGRGIKVCDRWRTSFLAFMEDVGLKPSPRYTIDRFPNQNGNYEPGNVRWATRAEQSQNLRSNVLITYNGVTKILAVWARETRLKPSTIKDRIYRFGWSVEKALTTPVGATVRKRR
jgi:hypothetical protein